MSIDGILERINMLNKSTKVSIVKTDLESTGWFYDGNVIRNENGTFFQISGFRNGSVKQPILVQNEIGYLGILAKRFEGIPHYLMQFKIEPGNVNCIQVSPTIQATKSNFTQAHGGTMPLYLNEFINADINNIIYDQIQSEQSSRFLGKRNRNIIIEVTGEVEPSPRHMWMTIPQIKALLKINNIVNMDTRTVLSCLPLYKEIVDEHTPLERSYLTEQPGILINIYNYINNYKMKFEEVKELIPLHSLEDWRYVNNELICKDIFPFKIVFCDISIEGREVKNWGQPLFEAIGMATFGLFTRVKENVMEFLVRACPEVGCFDLIELGPTVQLEATMLPKDEVQSEFLRIYTQETSKQNIKDSIPIEYHGIITHDVLLSEEGGRFFHEQNHNIIIEYDIGDDLPPGYWWCTYNSLNRLVQINNILNIQLRNLLSLL